MILLAAERIYILGEVAFQSAGGAHVGGIHILEVAFPSDEEADERDILFRNEGFDP